MNYFLTTQRYHIGTQNVIRANGKNTRKKENQKRKEKRKINTKVSYQKQIIYYVTMIFLNKIYLFDNLGDDDGNTNSETNEEQGKDY